jgi:hypothetical protein
MYRAYVQDDMKIQRNLSVDLLWYEGIDIEDFFQPVEKIILVSSCKGLYSRVYESAAPHSS